MFEKIKIAQANEIEVDIMKNLEVSDQKMVELNHSLVALLDEYQDLNFSQSSTPFFSFDNIYFWALLLGLLLLAISLGVLFKELKKDSRASYHSPKAEPLSVQISNEKVEIKEKNQTRESQPASSAKKKPIKIKVVKIKNKK